MKTQLNCVTLAQYDGSDFYKPTANFSPQFNLLNGGVKVSTGINNYSKRVVWAKTLK